MKRSLIYAILLYSSIPFFNGCTNNNEMKNKIHKELSSTAKSVNQYLPNKINKYIESRHQEVKDLTYISEYYIYLTIDANIQKTENAITSFQNALIDSRCTDKYTRDLMREYKVSYKYDFIDEFGQVQGFVLNDQECRYLEITIN